MTDFHYAQIVNHRGSEGPWRFQVLRRIGEQFTPTSECRPDQRVALDFVQSAGYAMELARIMDIGR